MGSTNVGAICDVRDLAFATDKVDASGSAVSVSNFPATQPVSGTVNVGNFPASTEIANDSGSPIPISDAGGSITVDGTVLTKSLNQLVPFEYDFIDLGYTGDDITTVVYKTGGSGGTAVATLTLSYSSPGVLDTVTRT